jgi:cytochrome b561
MGNYMANYVEKNKYHLGLRIIHWLMALMIITLIGAGYYMTYLPDDAPSKFEIFDIHKSVGLTVLMLATLRVAIRLGTAIPQMDKSFPNYIVLAAKAGHYLLYLFMFLMPVSGFLMSQFAGYKVAYFGIDLPFLVGKHPYLSGIFKDIHNTTAIILITVICLHILATIKHRYFDKKDVIYKMV